MIMVTDLNCAFIGMKHISPTFMYIIAIYLMMKTYRETFHLAFLLFLFRSGAPPMTLLTARALTAIPDPSCPPQLHTCAPLVHRLWPPHQNPDYAGVTRGWGVTFQGKLHCVSVEWRRHSVAHCCTFSSVVICVAIRVHEPICTIIYKSRV